MGIKSIYHTAFVVNEYTTCISTNPDGISVVKNMVDVVYFYMIVSGCVLGIFGFKLSVKTVVFPYSASVYSRPYAVGTYTGNASCG